MNLFVISTPSQAFFLSQTPQFIDKSSILLITKNKIGNEEKILYHLRKFSWKKIITIDITGIETLAGYHKIFFFSIYVNYLFRIKYRNIEFFFIGSYHNLFHLGLAAMFEKKAGIILLYDGLQMLTVANGRSEASSHVREQTKIFKLFGFKSPKLHSLTFISPVKFKIPASDKIVLIEPIHYELPQLRENLIYFVGQPLVDGGIVSLETYISKLLLLKNKFIGTTIIYIPHPGESVQMIKNIQVHLQIQYFDLIFEEIYMSSKYFSQTVISFYSSVLINLCYLKAETDIYSIEIFPHEIKKMKNIEAISGLYRFFKEVNYKKFKVLELP